MDDVTNIMEKSSLFTLIMRYIEHDIILLDPTKFKLVKRKTFSYLIIRGIFT